MFGAETVIFETDTELEYYAVVERTYEGRLARVLFSGVNRAAQSGVALDDDADLLFDYNQRFLELVSGVYPRKILLIGGGAYTLPMALLAAIPTLQVVVVEIDAGLEAIARDYFGYKPHERLKVIHDNGRHFLETTDETFDMILVDAFTQLTIPRELVTVEAAATMHNRLSPDGMVAVNIISAYSGRTTGPIRGHVAAYQTKFKRLDIFPAAHGLTTWLPQNMLFIAQKGQPRTLDKFLRFAPFEPLNVSAEEALRDKA